MPLPIAPQPRKHDIAADKAAELVATRKAEALADRAREAVEEGDEEALIAILLAMEP